MSSQIYTEQDGSALDNPPKDANNKRRLRVFAEEDPGDPSKLRMRAKDSNGNEYNFQGDKGDKGDQGDQGPVGPAGTLPITNVADEKDPIELESQDNTEGDLRVARKVVAGTLVYVTTYSYTPDGPVKNAPFVMNTSAGGTTRWVAVEGKFVDTSLCINGAVNRKGLAEFYGTTPAFSVNGADEQCVIDGEFEVDSNYYALDAANDEIDFLQVGIYQVIYAGDWRAIAATGVRNCELFAELATELGAFSEIPRSRSVENTRAAQEANAGRVFKLRITEANQRMRFMGNVSTQAINTYIDDLVISIERIGD